MDTKFQTSFIPKRPVLSPTDAPIKVHQPINLVGLISTIIFVLSVLAAGGLFAYQRYLSDRIESMEAQLVEARSSLGKDIVDKYVRLDTRLSTAKTLLNKHVAASVFFDELSQMTVRNVQFKEFSYLSDDLGNITIFLRGVADSYNSLALQSQLFSESKALYGIAFADMDLDEKGNVIFAVKAGLRSDMIAHRATLQELSFFSNRYEQ